jgi:hypothetical protein
MKVLSKIQTWIKYEQVHLDESGSFRRKWMQDKSHLVIELICLSQILEIVKGLSKTLANLI